MQGIDPEQQARWLVPLGIAAVVIGIAGVVPYAVFVLAIGIGLLLAACYSRTDGLLITGPFIRVELVRAIRRTRVHLWITLAAVFAAGIILTGYGFAVFGDYPRHRIVTAGSFIFAFMSWNLFLLAMSVTVTLMAYSIAEDRESKRVDFLLTSDLRSREIIIGKAVGRLLATMPYWFVLLPMIVLLPALFGIDPMVIALIAAVSIVTLGSLSAVAVWGSARAATKKVGGMPLLYVIAPYLLFTFAVDRIKQYPAIWFFPGDAVSPPRWALGDLLEMACVGNPILMAKGWSGGSPDPATIARDLPAYVAFHVGVGLTFIALAAAQLRRKSADLAEHRAGATATTDVVPAVGEAPVYWKERYFTKAVVMARQQKKWKLVSFIMLGLPAILFTAAAIDDLGGYANNIRDVSAVYTSILVWIFAAAGSRIGLESIVRERDQNTLTCLLTTGIGAEEIVRQKMRGILSILAPSWAMNAIVIAAAVACGGLPIWAGLLAVVMLMVYSIAFISVGLHTSARAPSLEAASKVLGWKMAPMSLAPPISLIAVAIGKSIPTDDVWIPILIVTAILIVYLALTAYFWTRTVRRFVASVDPAAEAGPQLSAEQPPKR
jgi:ABC-type Na+ efflux pump permease subunit